MTSSSPSSSSSSISPSSPSSQSDPEKAEENHGDHESIETVESVERQNTWSRGVYESEKEALKDAEVFAGDGRDSGWEAIE